MTRHALLRSGVSSREARPVILAPICTDIPFKVGTDLGGHAVARTMHGTGPRPEFGPARCVSSDGHRRVGRK